MFFQVVHPEFSVVLLPVGAEGGCGPRHHHHSAERRRADQKAVGCLLSQGRLPAAPSAGQTHESGQLHGDGTCHWGAA